jgi:hypothetical protein
MEMRNSLHTGGNGRQAVLALLDQMSWTIPRPQMLSVLQQTLGTLISRYAPESAFKYQSKCNIDLHMYAGELTAYHPVNIFGRTGFPAIDRSHMDCGRYAAIPTHSSY